jgi:hypothetical protein
MKLIEMEEVRKYNNHDVQRSSNEYSVNVLSPILHNITLNELNETDHQISNSVQTVVNSHELEFILQIVPNSVPIYSK